MKPRGDTNNKKPVFDEIAKTYSRQVLNLAYRLIGNFTEAEDLAQEVLLKAYRNLEKFRTGTNLTAWLYQITVNLFKDKLRYDTRRKKSLHVSLENADTEYRTQESGISIEDNLAAGIESSEQKSVVTRALTKLAAEERTVIVLRLIECKSYAEIAKILKCPVGTVKSRMFYACETLRKLLKEAESV